MVVKLYKMDMSSCCRAVLLTIKALNIPVEYIDVNLLTGENWQPHIAKLNPRCKVPILEDGNDIIWDSHAINIYLVKKYDKGNTLYPDDLIAQVHIHEWLHFDTEIFVKLSNAMIQLHATRAITEETYTDVRKVYEMLNNYLKGKKWITGDNLTIADFSLLSTIGSYSACLDVDSEKYRNIAAWIKEAERLPFYEATKKGIEDVKLYVKSMLNVQ
ncbi:hypothetical protein RI129_008430 [Pyrocoelia pectoralis]|uniref:Glutathione S-transferase n=1 Tax=Pyrocoelia pectoralis TaxID=417401 RepID=A0AAN7ZK63_9COLE